MTKKPKIAIYSGEIPSTTFVERLIEGLAQKDYVIYLFGIKTKALNYPDNVLNYGYINLPIHKGLYLIKYWILLRLFKNKRRKRLDSYLKTQGRWSAYDRVKTYPVLWCEPHIFHIQWAKNLSEWSWVRDFGMKLVLSLRGAHINYSPLADKELAEMYRKRFLDVDVFHAVCNAIGKEAEAYGLNPQRVRTIYSGLDLTRFPFQVSKEKGANLNILSVGRPHWIKGYVYALDACSILKTQSVHFTYDIIGAYGDIELLYQIEDLGLTEEVRLLQNESFNYVVKSMKEADILLLPSLKEGLANVVIEAMALGTVVVSSDCGGMNEVIEHGVNGFLFPVREAQAMADMLKYIGQLPEQELNEIRDKARNTIKEQHNLEQMVDGMEALYLDVVNS